MNDRHGAGLSAALVRAAAVSVLLLGVAPLRAPAQAEKTLLQFGPAAGTKLVYTINGQVAVGGKNFLGNSLDLNSSCNGDIRFWVKNAARDTVRADITTTGIDVQIQSPDRTLNQTLRTVDGKALDVVFNRTGRVQSISNAKALNQDSVMNFSIPQILSDYFPTFPAQPVAPGDQWRETRRLTVPFQEIEIRVDLAIDYTLTDIVPTPDGRRAVVSAAYTVTVSGSRPFGETVGSFEGKGSGTGFLNLLMDQGYFTDYRIDFKTDAAFIMRQGTKKLLEYPFTFSVMADVNQIPGVDF